MSKPGKSNLSVKIPISEIEQFRSYNHQIESVYMGYGTYYSITLDLVSLYLKGQKLLYTESKSFCEMILYALMLPAIFISSACTVLNVPLKEISYGATIVSALNGFNSFILAFITYMKLDAKAEAHKTSAYQFDKLQSLCEFWSGKAQLLPDSDIGSKTFEFIEEIEKKVGEIKDANQFSIPEVIRYRFNHIYSYNVFSIMKKYKTKRSTNIQKLININNVIKDKNKTDEFIDINTYPLYYKPTISFMDRFKNDQKDEEINIYDSNISIETLKYLRDKIIKDIIEHRDMTIDLTEKYNLESEHWINKKQKEWFPIFNWLKT
jgi:hypothetical protein